MLEDNIYRKNNENTKRDMPETAYLSLAYLGPVQYYSKIVNQPVYIESDCNYCKQTYRNRCNIASANGVMSLIIPVDKGELIKCKTKDIRIANHEGDWQRLHWRSIVSAYKSSPFFDYYQDDFLPFFEKRWDFLWDFNLEIQQLVISLLEVDVSLRFTSAYKTDFQPNEIDFRGIIQPKINFIDTDTYYISLPYYQVFKEKYGFQPNLSIIDLLFNMGNESRLILKNSFTSLQDNRL